MTIKLIDNSYEFAQTLIKDGRFVVDERDDWSEHQPSAQQENEFIDKNGIDQYRKWHLGEDDEEREDTKARYKFPYGDFNNVHRCGVLAAESRAGQYNYYDIENAAAHLHGLMDGSK